ncbi:MAG TPA: hypothetical protein VF025_06175 [Gaiellaceae bacterium]
MTARPTSALVILLALFVAAVALVAVELGKGAASSGPTVANPCKPRAPFPGSGLDATVQRIVLDGLDGAACSLRTTREELVLSLGPESDARPRRWDEHTIEVAIRSGLRRSVDEAERRGDIPPLIARAARRVVADAPIDVLIRGGIRLSDLIP